MALRVAFPLYVDLLNCAKERGITVSDSPIAFPSAHVMLAVFSA